MIMHIVHAMGSISLVSLLSHILISISITTAQPCNNTADYTSTYAENLNLILSSLPSNIVANGGFYFNTTIGQVPNKVYAYAICRGGSSPAECSSCVNSTSQNFLSRCPVPYQDVSWGDGICMVRYTNRTFFGILELTPLGAGTNPGDISWGSGQFSDIWSALMDQVAREAASGSSMLKYATGEANFTSFQIQTIYASMQCTPDILLLECETCLRQNVDEYVTRYKGKRGGIVIRANCYFRWEMYSFYPLMSDAPPPPPPPPTPPIKGKNTARIVIIVISVVIPVILIICICICIFLRARKPAEEVGTVDEIKNVESLQFDFSTIRDATNNFSDANKLGQGGFGAVYKGMLPSGQDIAVKRLSRNSKQGDLEFKNEVLLLARLQHRNLVRLLGFCLERKERLLVYEFLPNKSFNHFIFDPIEREHLDWERRHKIIGGIARGLLYLHEDSRLRIIHRDLKASNILLDSNMNPKISDFGMARLFEMDETQGDTDRIVGTLGYMAPEYVTRGHFSVKSDVFSFGMLVLEIVSGQKRSCFLNGEVGEDLLTFAWENRNEGTELNLVDPTLGTSSRSDIIRCIHIALLCVQENAADRPTMGSVVAMLSSYFLTLPVPSKPAFFMNGSVNGSVMPEASSSSLESNSRTRLIESDQSKRESAQWSKNEVSITELYPR